MNQMSNPIRAYAPLSQGVSGRRVLLLQGHPSAFWPRLGDALQAAGAHVFKVNFCLADHIFWGRRPAQSYRGRLEDWPDWLTNFVQTNGITDILYYADRFPYHAAARDVADQRGIKPWALEFGYLRPDWITFEEGGLGAASLFDRSIEGLTKTALGREEPDMTQRFPHDFSTEAFNEVTFGVLSVLGRPLYPRYVSDRFFWPLLDYLSWLPKLATAARAEQAAQALQSRLAKDKSRYFLLPMQIEADYQIRYNSPYVALEDFLNEVFQSFAQSADPEDRLVIKLHPLDSGLENWPRRLRRIIRRWDLSDRVDIARGGDLEAFIRHSRGVVLVNSTVGLHALRQAVPVHNRGFAIYDVAGLTHQGSLDAFWKAPGPVDQNLLQLFLRALTSIQIKGSFFNADGVAAACDGIIQKLAETPRSAH